MPDDSVWRDEAERRGFPDRFVERLAASDSVTEEEKQRIVGSLVTAVSLEEEQAAELSLREREIKNRDPGVLRTVGKTREEWVAQGRALGEAEALSRRESPADTKDRVARAMAYHAWEWDGKPQGYGDRYRLEFGYQTPAVLLSFDRPAKDPA